MFGEDRFILPIFSFKLLGVNFAPLNIILSGFCKCNKSDAIKL